MFAVLLLQCFVFIVFALDSENENTQVNGQNNQLHVEAVETEEVISATILNIFKRETKVGRKRTKKWKRGNKEIEKKGNNKRNGKVRKGKRNKSKKGNKQRRRGRKNNEPHRGKQKKKNHKGRKSKNAKSTRRNTKHYRKVKSKKENKQRKRKNNKSPRSRKSKKTKSARGNPRVLTGDNCQWLDFGTARSRGSNCADGTKMVIKNKKGVRKQFLLTNGKTIYGFVRKGEKFANCSTFSEITDSVDCKSVAGLSSVTLSRSTRAVGQPSGRAYVGKGCEWIDISKVRTSGQNCADGFKFVISGEKGTRKQFLLVDGRDIIAFVKNKEKFTNCSSFTEVTSQVDCKSVSGVGAISLTGSGSPSPAPSSAPSPSTSSGGDNNAAYCVLDENHTMCKYKGPSASCGEKTIFRTLSADGKAAILDRHNTLRRRVAKGEETGGVNAPQPASANMKKMVWNNELEEIAQRWADQCNFGHDSVRGKLDGTSVGQNAFIGYSSAQGQEGVIQAAMASPAQSWYDEVTSPGFDSQSINHFKFNSGTGHYTQMVWAESEEIGCAVVYFKDTSALLDYNNLVICNYAKAGNFLNSVMYQTGTACSACPAGYTCDDGLCAK